MVQLVLALLAARPLLAHDEHDARGLVDPLSPVAHGLALVPECHHIDVPIGQRELAPSRVGDLLCQVHSLFHALQLAVVREPFTEAQAVEAARDLLRTS